MFLFGSTAKVPRPKQKPLGMDETHASTSEEARPVPWFAGKTRIGLTFITDVFKQKAVSVTQTVGKKKSQVGYNYYASFAAAACHGPVFGLHDIILNGDSVYASEIKLEAISLTRVDTTATFKTKNAHGLVDGQTVIVENANQGDYNGVVTIDVISATEFTYEVLGSPVTPATGKITAKIQLDPIYREGDNLVYVDVLIPDYGNMRLYWGTHEQIVDPILAAQSGVVHTPYRGICYAVFDQLFLGFNQTNVPNVELILSRKPEAAWHALDYIGDDANPIAAAIELLQHPSAGVGVVDADLNTVDLLLAAGQLEDEAFGLSPVMNRQQSASEFLIQLMEYFDGYPTSDDLTRLSVGLCRNPIVTVTLTDADIVEFPSFNPDDWRAGFTAVDVKFIRGDRFFKEDMIPHRETFLKSITGRQNPKTLERTWITDKAVAEKVAMSSGRSMAMPANPGSVTVLRKGTLFDDLAPGSTFKFNVTGRDLRWQIFRVDERIDPSSDSVDFKITFHVDRSYLYVQ